MCSLIRRLLTLLILLSACGCESQDERLLRQVERQAELQADQARRFADMQADVTSGSRRLVEHDASARAAWTTLNQQLEDARAELDRQRQGLHAEQQAFIRRQAVAPLVAEAILQIGKTAICVVPLAVFVWFVLRTRSTPNDEFVADALLDDWLDQQPTNQAPKLIGLRPGRRSDPDGSA